MTPEEQAELEAAQTAQATAENESAIARATATKRWLHPADAAEQLGKRLARNAKKEIVWHSATLLNADGTPTEIDAAAAVAELAESRPHWLAPAEKFNILAGGNTAKKPPCTTTYAELIDPKNQKKLEAFMSKRPKEFSRLRAAHYGE